ncbi:MAG TPA: hypothetical protein VFA65_11990 [Bryobacteraceae bacterium]|nr:hypothetical protein [Bryobacteraceae bacterium]
MFGKVLRNLCRERGGLAFVAGAIGVLKVVEYVLSAHETKPRMDGPKTVATPRPVRRPRFKITRTKSDLGYAYWVLREFGPNPTYALFDTWREAMDEALRRIDALSNLAPESDVDLALVSV